MSNYRYSADLVGDILFRTGDGVSPTDRSSEFSAVALQYLNRAYQQIYMGGTEIDPSIHEDWWWLRKNPPGVLVLDPQITTGTVAVTNNSAAITFSSAPAVSVANRYFKVDAHADVFRISTHTAASTAATLDSVYTGLTSGAVAFRVMHLDYDLASDAIRIIDPMRMYRTTGRLEEYRIYGMDLLELERTWPLAMIETGAPDAYAHVAESKVRFNRSGGTTATDLVRVEYDYLARPADLTDSMTEEPVVPLQWRYVLSDLAAHLLFLDKNDDRTDAAGLAARQGVKSMSMENRHKKNASTAEFGAIVPRQDQVGRWRRGPLRTQSGLIIG